MSIPAPPPILWVGVAGAAGYWVGTKIEPYVSPIIWPYLQKIADECGDDCDGNLEVCLENKFWAPKNYPFGWPLDCTACYYECKAAGAWPHYKCPLPK